MTAPVESQGALQASFDGSTIRLTRVGTASTWTGPSAMEADGILSDVFDPETGTLRIVEV